jgi:hypothetical protein
LAASARSGTGRRDLRQRTSIQPRSPMSAPSGWGSCLTTR